ncbi:hypothetical protein MMC30_008542 [Trapelia coarctata]|nr:hypothetical protein [Trapelia coarctata]
MRILCLHGYGTSGAILKNQLDAFIRQADASYEFVFLDGEYECPKAQGTASPPGNSYSRPPAQRIQPSQNTLCMPTSTIPIPILSLLSSPYTPLIRICIGNFATGPFLAFNRAFSPADIQSSLEHLQAFIDDEGPFDGLLGFSQGGSLALTYLLQETLDASSPPSPSSSSSSLSTTPPFKFAIILSTIVAFSPDPSFCAPLLTTLSPADSALLSDFPHCPTSAYKALSAPPSRAIFFESLGLVLGTSLRGGFIAPDTDLGLEYLQTPTLSTPNTSNDDLPTLPRLIHPSLLPPDIRIRIPTIHVTGRKDEPALVAMSRLMEEVCVKGMVRSLSHEGGHDVPRGLRDVKALWGAVEWAVGEGLRGVW